MRLARRDAAREDCGSGLPAAMADALPAHCRCTGPLPRPLATRPGYLHPGQGLAGAGAHQAGLGAHARRRGAGEALALGRHLAGGAHHGARPRHRALRARRRQRPQHRLRPRPRLRHAAAGRGRQQRHRRPSRHPLRLPARAAAGRGDRRGKVSRHDTALPRCRRRDRRQVRDARAGAAARRDAPDAHHLLPLRRPARRRPAALRRHRPRHPQGDPP